MAQQFFSTLNNISKTVKTVTNAISDAQAREFQIEQQMAALRLEHSKIQDEKMKKEQAEVMLAIKEDKKKEAQKAYEATLVKLKTKESELNNEIDAMTAELEALIKIQQQSIREKKSSNDLLLDAERKKTQAAQAILTEIDQEIDELKMSIGKPVVMKQKAISESESRKQQTYMADARSFIVPQINDKNTTGANALYQWLETAGVRGRMDYKILTAVGPPHAPIFTAQLIVTFPVRRNSLNVTYSNKGTSKTELKNKMCAEILPLLKAWHPDLTMCGDVEANPGPVFSRDQRQSYIQPSEHGGTVSYSFQERVYRKYRWQNNIATRNQHQKEVIKPEDSFLVEDELQYNPRKQRSKYFRQHEDEKMKRLERDYRSRHKKLRKTQYTGELNDDMKNYINYLDKHGYASRSGSSCPPWFIQKIFEKWCRHGHLIDEDRAWKMHLHHMDKFELPKHDCFYKSRVLIMRAFVADPRVPESLRWLRIFLSRVSKMPTDIGVTLKDVGRVYQKMSKSNQRFYDMTYAQPQMMQTEKGKPEQSWFDGTLRKVGQKIGEGMTDVVMPVINKVKDSVRSLFSSFPDLKTCLFFLKVVGFLVLVAILGWAIVTVTRSITMFLGGFTCVCSYDEPPDAADDLNSVTVQHFGFSTAKFTVNAWLESLGTKFSEFNQAFSDAEVMKFTKKLGDFSAAVKNIEWLLAKIKEVVIWCINKTSTIFCDKPFFQDARNVQALQGKINELMKVVQVDDVSNMTDPAKEAFCTAYMDLCEMQPFVFKVDKWLGGQIQSAITKAHPLYKASNFYLKTNLERMEPWYISMAGKAGQGKTIFTNLMAKMIYDAMKIISYKTWVKLFYNDGAPGEWNSSLIYNRQPEQEFWDNYNNQPITKLDDLGQTKQPPEMRTAEFFSIIRMVNSAPYPLHMADIMRKETTVFKSFLVFTTTNMTDNQYTSSELGILEAGAYLRRRDVHIRVDRTPGWVKEGINSKEYLDTYTLEVFRPDKQTGENGEGEIVKGYSAISNLVFEMCIEIIARYGSFHETTSMDHTHIMSQLYTQKKVVKQISKMYDDMGPLETDQQIAQREVDMQKNNENLKKILDDTIYTESDDDLVNLEDLDTGTGVFTSSEKVKTPVTTASSKSEIISTMDMSTVNTQMLLAGSMWGLYKTVKSIHASFQYAHPSMTALLKEYGHYATTYSEAKHAITLLRKQGPPFFQAIGFDHDFIVNGVLVDTQGTLELKKENRATSFVKYKMGLFSHKEPSVNARTEIYRELLEREAPISGPWEISGYIGLTNSIYYTVKQGVYNEIYSKYAGGVPIWFDDVKATNAEKLLPDHSNLYWYEVANEKALRSTHGKSQLYTYMAITATVLACFVGLVLVVRAAVLVYQRMDPRPIDMSFVEPQSSDPRLAKRQQEIARSRKLPVANVLKDAKLQWDDAGADAIRPKLRHNTYNITGEKGDTCFTVHGVGIKKTIFLVPGHWMQWKPETIYIESHDRSCQYQFPLAKCKWQYVREHKGLSSADLCLLWVPGMAEVSDLTCHLFLEKDDLNGVMGITREDFVSLTEKPDGTVERTFNIREDPGPIKEVNSENYANKKHEVFRMGICAIPGSAGDCVKGYIMNNPKVQRKLGYFHVALAGDKARAIMGRLNQEDVAHFEKYLNDVLTDVEKQMSMKFTVKRTPTILNNAIKYETVEDKYIYGFQVQGKLNRSFVSPGKTAITPTPMCVPWPMKEGDNLVLKEPPFPVLTAPAILRPKDDKDPMNLGLQSFKNRKIIYGGYIKPEDYDGIFVPSALKYSTGRLLSLYEVLTGMMHPNSRSVKLSTSMAFYHKVFNRLKRDYCDITEEAHRERKMSKTALPAAEMVMVGPGCYLHHEVLQLLTGLIKGIKKGTLEMNWVVAMLKDECRTLDRVAACKTRVFYAGNFAFMLLSRMVFGEFVCHLETNWMDTDVAVGCNPYSADWKIIFDKIIKHGTFIDDADTEKWDQHYPVLEFNYSFCPRYVEFYNLKDKLVTIDLIEEQIELKHEDLIYGVCIMNFELATVIKDVVVFFLGQGSGVDLTTIFNSICNSACNRCIVRRLTLLIFNEVATMWTYGDDLMLNCPLVTRAQTSAEALKLFDHTRTNPDKSSMESEKAHIFKVAFLQREFKIEQGIVTCPLNIKSIHNMLQWIDRPKHPATFEQQFVINCKTALMELSRHGEDKYELYRKEINIYLAQYGTSWVINMTYKEAFQDALLRYVGYKFQPFG